jgi:hypothetical protein
MMFPFESVEISNVPWVFGLVDEYVWTPSVNWYWLGVMDASTRDGARGEVTKNVPEIELDGG